ncbi:dTDP-4-dehydrorhamnose 3,5-epimerase family protein [Nocardia sp. IFM 10818]
MIEAPTFRECAIEGAFEFAMPVHRDDRGLFTTPLRASRFRSASGRPMFAVRDISFNVSARGVLRGIHFTTTPPGRAKYVYCPYGRVTDYLVDLRIGSPTFGRCDVTELVGDRGRALYIPIGVGHAFLSRADDSVIAYAMSEEYTQEHELAVSALDPRLGLSIPRDTPLALSDRDRHAPTLAEAVERGMLPTYQACRDAEVELWS